MVERHTNCFNFPLDRCRWIMDGESFDVGDRTLHALRPPVFDSPTTRGLFDPTTGVYWAVDTFATPLPDPKMGDRRSRPRVLGLRHGAVRARRGEPVADDGSTPTSTAATSTRVQNLDITTIAACHTPVIEGPFIEQAFDRIRQLPTLDPPPLPDQSVLDQIIAATSQPQE